MEVGFFLLLLLLASIVPYFDAIAPSAAAFAVAVIVAVVPQVTHMYVHVRTRLPCLWLHSSNSGCCNCRPWEVFTDIENIRSSIDI